MLSRVKRSHFGIVLPVAVAVVLAGSVIAAGAASAVGISPRQHNGAQGIVASVGGLTTPDTCLGASTGSFTLTGGMRQAVATVVDVTPATTYKDPAVTTPTFADVCVGSRVMALGTHSSGTLAATLVAVIPAQAQGLVTSVNGTAAANTCGTSGASGTLLLAGGMRQAVTTVDITAGTTTFTDVALTAPSFVNVCVGSRVIALGTLSSGALAATLVTIVPAQAQGIVTAMAVAGATATCGTSGASGTVTLAGGMRQAVTAVDITAGTTTFTDVALTAANFGNVCVGSRVIALGTLSSSALAATLVTIVPAQAQGTVTALTVAGVTANCGTSGASGILTFAGGIRPMPLVTTFPGLATTVDVTATTTYTDVALTPPTSANFGNVCVGSRVVALGTLSSGTLTATLVEIAPAQAQGIVASVSGGTATDTCLSTSTGSFTLTGGIRPVLVTTLPGPDTTVVDVTATTTYKDPAVTTPTFANLCVGDRVTTLGALVSGTLTATSVTIVPAQVQGIVASVTVGGNTSTAANSCGTADEAGSFTLGGMRPLPVVTGLPGLVTTVVVAVGTTYKDPAVATPSFANVCVGSRVIALGTLVSGSLAATLVTIAPPLNLSGGHGNRRGPGKS